MASEPRTLLKTISRARGRGWGESHARSHTDEQPSDDPDRVGRPGETSPRSRTDLNGAGRLHGYLRVRRLGVRVPPSVHDLYNGQRMRPEKLAAWRALRERYGNRDESRVDQGTLLAPAA